jgi:hypothetical protein
VLFARRKRSFEQIFRDHILLSNEAANRLMELFTDFGSADRVIGQIVELEHRGDDLVRETFRLLDTTFIARYDKPDIEHLITMLDNVLDTIRKIATGMQVYRIVKLRPEALQFSRIIIEMMNSLTTAITNLSKLRSDTVQQHVVLLKQLEEQGDELGRQAIGRLFEEENDCKSLVKWKDIFEGLESITDTCEDVIDVVSSITRKESP